MNFLMDVMDSTPILGHVIGFGHYIAGNDERGFRCLYKATRSSSAIAGATVGCMAGPGGAVYGCLSAITATDCLATIATHKTQGYVRHTENIVDDFEHRRDPCKSLLHAGVDIGFDAVGGVGMNAFPSSNSFTGVTSSVGKQILKKSVYMERKDVYKKVSKNVLKHGTHEFIDAYYY